jgi:two-component system, NarL family, nitrate/nitrite response regulator NarL
MHHVEKPIRVLICNKYTLFREGIKAMLPRGGRIEIAGEASCAKQAIGMLAEVQPDVVLMDLALPDMGGWEATRRIKAIAPDIKVLIVSLSDDKPFLFRCLKAGAAGHVCATDLPLHLQNSIQTVYRGGAHAA